MVFVMPSFSLMIILVVCLRTFSKKRLVLLMLQKSFLADIAPYGTIELQFSAFWCFDFDVTPSGNVTDNRGEFISGNFQQLLLKHCIKHKKSAPYLPHQNGTAERSWHTLFDMARALIIESEIPKQMWTYTVMTATHIRNRCYSQQIKSTPLTWLLA